MIIAIFTTELYKLLKQARTWYALGALLLIEGIVLFAAYYQGTNIIDILLDNLKQNFYFEGDLVNGNLLIYLILNTMWFHLPLILMIVISGMLTSEYKDRTLQTVMLQPVSRAAFITGKFLVAIVFTVFVVIMMALSSFILSYSFFGSGDLIVYLDTLNFFSADDALKRLCLAYAAGTFSMVFFSVASLTIAVIFKEATKTWIVAAFFLIICNLLVKVDLGYAIFDDYFFAKLNDTWQYFFYFDIDWSRIFMNLSLLTVYIILFILAGVFIFKKNDIG
ncbi:ABC transporter permease [Robertkochia solimangrovi]|uniref:ABC transporter permease n=1 Tax=Robertkochia solimangrovi TaxID=2213046 RepID=UPI00117F2DE4|nr:ABC transporter permease [Robertkochia solimangrovi]TRZ41820.1 ABC transporter permease [Robertkochia solimangrovi]